MPVLAVSRELTAHRARTEGKPRQEVAGLGLLRFVEHREKLIGGRADGLESLSAPARASCSRRQSDPPGLILPTALGSTLSRIVFCAQPRSGRPWRTCSNLLLSGRDARARVLSVSSCAGSANADPAHPCSTPRPMPFIIPGPSFRPWRIPFIMPGPIPSGRGHA